MDNDSQKRLDELYDRLNYKSKELMGYPIAHSFDYSSLYRFLEFPINNIGDPFQPSTYHMGTREMEREVVDFFAALFKAEPGSYWGYVTNGGTEGNLYGLYLARELYPNGIVYFSEDTHYSVAKNVHLLGMRHIMISSQANGEIDYDDLKESIRLHRDVPAIVFANIGTTMKEARDDTLRIRGILDSLVIHQRYIHSDGAFCGPYAQFLTPKPAFDFTEGADSIAISGHKFLGSPIPCGVVIARKDNVERIGQSIGYIGCRDTTITGSRNAFSPLLLWHVIKTYGVEGLKERIGICLDVADYTVKTLNEHGIPAWRNTNALTVVIPKASDAIKLKWALATQGEESHIILAPGVTKERVDALVRDLVTDKKENAA
ncbi:MAG TPA: histidine decarboxylase [Rickettsiales bacterium]|nr:histidine decarboxylase [Rickettsiales bacterium]